MKKKKLFIYLVIFIAMNFGTVGYFGYQNYLLKEVRTSLEGDLLETKVDLALTTKSLESTIDFIESELDETITERDNYALKFRLERERMDSLTSKIEGIEGTVGKLEKLSQTDPELLKKYSKVYFLNENFVPKTFTRIDSKYAYRTEEVYLIYSEIEQFFKDMLAAMDGSGVDIKIISAYRSFGKQSELKSTYAMMYGSGANMFSADQGYSEHQLGTAIDFTTSEVGATFSGFENTEAYQWLSDNAYKYGFILSYPEDNQYYQFEPWHWRFVGRALAEKLHQEGKNFYDLSQREIDQYLISFFD